MVDIVTLPACPPPVSGMPYPVEFATDLQGPLGGPTQRITRLGTRFRVELSWAPMEYDDARRFIARLLRAEAAPLAVPVLQRGLKPVSPGPLVVDGARTTASLLAVANGTPGFLLKEGQFFSLSSGGRRYLHNVEQDTVLDANGAAGLPITPLLRVAPATYDATEWVSPLLEGLRDIGSVKPTLEMLVRVGLQIAVTEDR